MSTRATDKLEISVTVDGALEQYSTPDMADYIRDGVLALLHDYEQYVRDAGTQSLDDPMFEIVVMEVNAVS
jgi:hypothetical protein